MALLDDPTIEYSEGFEDGGGRKLELRLKRTDERVTVQLSADGVALPAVDMAIEFLDDFARSGKRLTEFLLESERFAQEQATVDAEYRSILKSWGYRE